MCAILSSFPNSHFSSFEYWGRVRVWNKDILLLLQRIAVISFTCFNSNMMQTRCLGFHTDGGEGGVHWGSPPKFRCHNCLNSYNREHNLMYVIVISLPGGWSFYTLVSGVARHQCARPHPREGYNYYITCYLGNITVQERYGQHS